MVRLFQRRLVNACVFSRQADDGDLISLNEELTGFYPRHLETFIDVLEQICDANWGQELKERYLEV